MNCPVCEKEAMIVLELAGVEIDYCVACGGIWLDAGELEILLESSLEKNKFFSSFYVDSRTEEKKRKCPICLKWMEKVSAGVETKIRIDRCKKGDGIWFDSGELEKAIKIASAEVNSAVLNLLKEVFANLTHKR